MHKHFSNQLKVQDYVTKTSSPAHHIYDLVGGMKIQPKIWYMYRISLTYVSLISELDNKYRMGYELLCKTGKVLPNLVAILSHFVGVSLRQR